MDYKVELDQHEYEGALKYMKGNTAKLTRRMVGIMAERAAGKVRDKISGTAHFKTHPTGQLMNSVHQRITSSTDAEINVDAVYGAIHEYGGTIKHPGGTAYVIDTQGIAHWVSNSNPWAKMLPRTKPHHIYIPPRPYFHPTIKKYLESNEAKQEMHDTVQDFIDEAINANR